MPRFTGASRGDFLHPADNIVVSFMRRILSQMWTEFGFKLMGGNFELKQEPKETG